MCLDKYPSHWKPKLLHNFLLQYSVEYPDEIAIVHKLVEWTYSDLEFYADRYTENLRESGLQMGDRVILNLDPCPQAVALIIACSRLGLVFIPVSPDTPEERLMEIISLSGAALHIENNSDEKKDFTEIDIFEGEIQDNVLTINTIIINPTSTSRVLLDTDLAYIIFTSGTTGKPKGIMMTHKAVLSFFEGLVEHCKIAPRTRIGTISPLQFDLSILDMGMAFGSGGTLVQVPRILVHHPKRFVSYLIEKGINKMSGVPSIWHMVLKHAKDDLSKLTELNSIFYAGEEFLVSKMREIQELIPNIKLTNCFGQSESIASTFKDITEILPLDINAISIGKAHPGVELLLIASDGKVVTEAYTIGEIYLRGSSLFSGYWRNEIATSNAVVNNPINEDSGEKVFRTGDLAYMDENGEFYYQGRRDFQVKVLGNRVELEEVERIMCSHPYVSQAVVIPEEENGILYLVCFLVIKSDKQDLKIDELREYCLKWLPKYMIPSEFNQVNELPLTANGKVDREYVKSKQRDLKGRELLSIS